MDDDRHEAMTGPDRQRFWRRARQVAGVAVFAASASAAQMVSIPLGGPRAERPSPNAALRGAPADIAAAVAAKGRPAAMRRLDAARHPAEVLAFLGLFRGARVLVVERDPGYLGEIIGAAVAPGGGVTELLPPVAMRDPGARTTLSEDIALAPGLSLLAATPATARLAPDSLDFVVLYLADGDVFAPAAAPVGRSAVAPFPGKLFAAVRPGGIVGVVDGGHADDDPPGRAGPEAAAVKRDFARAGFVVDGEGRISGDDDRSVAPAPGPGAAADVRRYILKFRKPE